MPEVAAPAAGASRAVPNESRQPDDVSMHPPLGGYEQFARSRGGPFRWGEGGRSRIVYGEEVLPDLVRGLRELPGVAAEGMPGKAEVRPAVIGWRVPADVAGRR